MSSTQDSFESYITQTLSAEEQAAADAARSEAVRHAEFLTSLRTSLQTALDADDRKAAIRIAHELLEYNEDDDKIRKLYNFLLTRVGVTRREPYFAFSTQPVVRSMSAIGVLVPMIFLIAHILSPTPEHHTSQTDALTCVFAALFFGVPLLDSLFATVFNYVNRYRLRE